MTLPWASSAARALWIEAGPFGSQPVPWSRMYCSRTALPTALASTAQSAAQSSASLRPYEPGPLVQRTCTLASGTLSWAASPCCTKWLFCVPLQQSTLSPLMATTQHAGPIGACDWYGHSYSASITLAADLYASSTLPAVLPSTADLRTAALRMWSYSAF